jgi:glycosyltransferase involved in cell wall biosynthesis
LSSRPLRVAHIAEAFDGGVATYMNLVLPALQSQGLSISLFCSDQRGDPRIPMIVARLRAAGVEVRAVRMCRELRPWRDAAALVAIRRSLRAGRFDVVHTHGTKGGMLGRLAAWSAGVPAIHTPHCFAFLRADGRLRRRSLVRMERVLGRITASMAAVSESERDAAVRSKIMSLGGNVVIPNGLDLTEEVRAADPRATKRSLGIREDALVVILVARLVAYKGVLLFLDAARRCPERRAVFLVAGEGGMRPEAEEFIRAAGLVGRARLLGHVQDVAALAGSADLCVSCARAEGQAYALLEVMRAGCPVLAVRAPGVTEVVESQGGEFLTEADPAALAGAVAALLSDSALRRAAADAGRARVLRHHSLLDQARGLRSLYERVCGRE